MSPNRPRTVSEDWQHEVDRIDGLLDGNAALLISALRDEDYYPDLDPPSIDTPSGLASPGETIVITNPNSKGKLYITTDGSDPRLSGGSIATTAQVLTDPLEITTSTRIKSRVLVASIFGGSTWSALTERSFYTKVPELRINEIMYHPAAPTEAEIQAGFTNDDDFEYLVLTNPSNEAIPLNGIRFIDGIQFTAEADALLSPGEQAVIARNPAAFAFRYASATPLIGPYTQSLSNGGERLALVGSFNEPILDFSYQDDWQESTDGQGSALVLTNLDAPGMAQSWQAKAPLQNETPSSQLRLAVEQTSPNAFTLILHAAPAATYLLEISSDLEQWSEDGPLVTADDGIVTTKIVPEVEQTRFYRVRQVLQ